jgi:hypothetical protein
MKIRYFSDTDTSLIEFSNVSVAETRYEMADLKYKPVSHDHEAFLKKASKRKEFRKAYEDLEEEYRFTCEMLAARSKFGLGQQETEGINY